MGSGCDCRGGPSVPTPTPAQREAAAKRSAASRQKAAADAAAHKLASAGDGVLLRPGPRGKRGHSRRCDVADDAKVLELLTDQSNILWRKSKPLFEIAAKLLVDDADFESLQSINDIEAECRELGSDFARIEWVNRLGGDKIENIFKQTCDLSGHLDGVAENAILDAIEFIFDTPAGEYLSLVFNKVITGSWPNTVDFCALVCRKNKSGDALKECLIGCPETHPSVTGCWSQCSNYTCRRACKNAFNKLFRNKDRKRCYSKCDSKCSYD